MELAGVISEKRLQSELALMSKYYYYYIIINNFDSTQSSFVKQSYDMIYDCDEIHIPSWRTQYVLR